MKFNQIVDTKSLTIWSLNVSVIASTTGMLTYYYIRDANRCLGQ